MTGFARGLLGLLVATSLAASWLASSTPLVVRYQGRLYFPAFRFYPASTFADDTRAIPDYRDLAARGVLRAWFTPIPYDPDESDPALVSVPPTSPDRRHWLGTDDRGRDLLARLLHGLWPSLVFAVGTWFFSALFGYAFGLWQGYHGGKRDLFGQRLVEIGSVLPPLHFLLFALCLFRPSLWLLTLTWVAFGWLPFAAYARVEALRLRETPFLEAAVACGVSRSRLFFRHLLPHALSPLRALTPIVLSANIAALAGLDYLGLGLPPPTPSWGELLRQGRENPNCGWLFWTPLIALVLLLWLVLLATKEKSPVYDKS